MNFSPIIGTIPKDDQLRLKKLIYRTSRGKAYTQFFNIKEKIFDYYGNEIHKSIFIVLLPNNFTFLRQKM
jgi:hypothetical protein